jgi:glycerol kinase
MALEVEPSDAGKRALVVRILAIDQGTSATKAVVFGEDGDIVTSVEVPVTPRAVPGGGVEQDPEQLWLSVCGRRSPGRERV